MVLDGNLNPVAWTHPDGVLPTFLRQGTDQSVRGDDAGLPRPVRQGDNLGVRVLRRDPGRDPRQVGHAAAPALPASGHDRHPAADLHLRRRGGHRAAGHCEPVAVRRQRAAATLGGLDADRRSAAASPARVPRPARRATAATLPPAVYTGLEQTFAVLCSDSPNPRDPAAYPAAARSGLRPVGRLRPGVDVGRGGVRGLAGRRGPGPLLRPVEPAHGHHHPGPRQHRRPGHCPTRTRSRCPGTWPAPGC